MNRYLIIAIFFVIVVAAVGGVWFLRLSQVSSTGQGGTASTTTLPAVPQPSAQSSADVTAAFQSQIPQGYQVTLGGNVIAGNYAIQLWSNINEGGEALLKYDLTQRRWSTVSWGGGTWSVAGLVGQGVPQATAAALLAATPH